MREAERFRKLVNAAQHIADTSHQPVVIVRQYFDDEDERGDETVILFMDELEARPDVNILHGCIPS